jgi:hypothetical protein
MVPRATLIAVLIGVEVALVVAMAGAVRGRSPATWFGFSHDAGIAGASAPSWTFPAGAAPAVRIDIGLADLTIETRPGAQQIAVAVVPGAQFGPSGTISARDEAGAVRITAPSTSDWHFFQEDDRNVHVTVPPQTRIEVISAGDIVADGLRGGASFDGDGVVTVNDFRGDLTASSSNGHIEITDADCTALHVSSSNGRVTLRRVSAQQIVATSSNGRIEATALDVRNGSVSSSNGRVSLGFAPGASTTVTAEASNGSVRVSGLAAASGATTATTASDDEDDDGDDGSAKTVRVGAGGGQLDVHAGNGNIDLMRES